MAKGKRRDRAASVATNRNASAAERHDATVEMHRGGLPDLLPKSDLQPTIDYINERYAEELFNKSMNANVVPFPSKNTGKRGVQSVVLDDFQIVAQGSYWDRPGLLAFDSMRAMVESTPILNSIILTRIRQVQRFCRPQTSRAEPGFVICHVDQNAEISDEKQKAIALLQKFVINCGWEFDPRRRKRLKRDTFPAFIAKHVRDTLTLDAGPIETEWKRNKSLGIDGFYAIDGGSIRLCTEEGYEGDDEIFALQVIQGRIRTAYSYEDLIYEVRNPRSDVTACGYGYGETEMLIRIVTYLLNALTYNGSFFDKNSIPRGLLHLSGNYSTEDLAAFKRYWTAMVKGVQNAHNLPVLVSKDQESRAEFAEIGGQLNEMAFAKWLSFLTSIACAVYGIAPEEIAMESFAAEKSAMGGNDTEERITSSKDKSLRPMLAFLESEISDWIIQPVSEDLMLRFVGLDTEDETKNHELFKLVATVDEGRRKLGMDKAEGPLGPAPLNPALLGAWQQESGVGQPEQEQQDFGQPPGGSDDEDAAGGDQADQGDTPAEEEDDFGQQSPAPPDIRSKAAKPPKLAEEAETLSKALADRYGLPELQIYRVPE